LGTHTVGRFIANVQQGAGIEVSGDGAEDAVATVSHADTSTLSGLQGGAGIASITVDGFGHVTAVDSATYLTTPGLNVAFTGDVTGTGNINLTNSSTNSLTIALTVQPNSVALGTDTTGNYTDRVVGGTGISVTGTGDEGNVLTADLTATGVVASTYGNATIVPVITIDAQGTITSASNVTISGVGGGGGPSTDTLANVTARGNITSDTITITNVGNSLIASGNIQTSGNVIIPMGNLFEHRFFDISNVSYFVEPVSSDSVVVSGNVYTNQRIGFMNVNTTTTVVYQYYNPATNSLDTVFS